ncbi:MAG: hypothetical protein K0R50_2238 [Eubacterium sp.]|jgi:molecular chaperone GrpE|nr:hypothetical protein [Eubacterium sp.]
MKKDKNLQDTNDEVNVAEQNEAAANTDTKTADKSEAADGNSAVEELKAKLEEKNRQCEEFTNMVQRTAAEFDNYKKRTVKEKEALSLDAAIDTINAFLPVVDNLERALKAAEGMEGNPLKDGVEMVMRQLKDCLDKLGVEPIQAVNNSFDPELHNAVMHVTDDESGDNLIIEEFQKGYTMKGKVVRHSMVKVAN